MTRDYSLAKWGYLTWDTSALFVVDQNASQSSTTITFVKPAIGISHMITVTTVYVTGETGENGLPPTAYVRTAMYRLPLEGVESFSTKCPTEKTIQPHEYVKITPANEDPEFDPMESLKLTKRLTLCTSCGTLRLIN